MTLFISPRTRAKLARPDHNVTEDEIIECFANRYRGMCLDKRPEHQNGSGLPTLWFVAETNYGRRLKIVFIDDAGTIEIKSAYPATEEVTRIYEKYAQPE